MVPREVLSPDSQWTLRNTLQILELPLSDTASCCKSLLLYWTLPLWAPSPEIPTLTFTSRLLVWVVLRLWSNHWCKFFWWLLCGHGNAGGPKGMGGLHPRRHMAKGLPGAFGWQPRGVRHCWNLELKKKKNHSGFYGSMTMEAIYRNSLLFYLNPYLMESWKFSLRRRKTMDEGRRRQGKRKRKTEHSH